MKDWKAAARNWMNNAIQFTKTQNNGREKTDASIAAKFVSDTNEAIRIVRERHSG
jgi:hypothetical protein